MTLKVIGAGLGRTGTMSLKLALEHLGFGPCHHMSEVLANARTQLPLWLGVVGGAPDWDAIFAGYASTTDYPACNYWRELAGHFPEAKVILTVRNADGWFDSVSRTIFSDASLAAMDDGPMRPFIDGAMLRDFGDRVKDRAFMVDYFNRRIDEIRAALPPERLLVLESGAGWAPLCAFLGVPVPAEPYPRVNTSAEWNDRPPIDSDRPPSPEDAEAAGRSFIATMRERAFGG